MPLGLGRRPGTQGQPNHPTRFKTIPPSAVDARPYEKVSSESVLCNEANSVTRLRPPAFAAFGYFLALFACRFSFSVF